jgi:hypothetical protein
VSSVRYCVLTFVVCAAAGLAVRGELVLTNYNASAPLKIMAVGDSITDDCSVNGAWRRPLQPLLETNGFPFTFVGARVRARLPGLPGSNTKVTAAPWWLLRASSARISIRPCRIICKKSSPTRSRMPYRTPC